MIKKNIIVALALFAVSIFSVEVSTGQNITKYLRRSLKWSAPKLNTEIPLKIYYKEKDNIGREDPVIVYIMNHNSERIGQESDESILQDYINQRYIIVTVDFQGLALAYSPYFDEDLLALHRALDGYNGAECIFDGTDLYIDEYNHYFLPAGYRILRDLVYFELDKHGSYGTKDEVVRVWNNTLYPRGKVSHTIDEPKDLKTPEGTPLDWKLRMDVIYPSQPDREVPMLVYASTQSIRMRSFRTELKTPHFYGFAMRGYACAMIDHCWNPLARHTAYGYFDNTFTMHFWNGLKSNTAAIRYLNSRAGDFGHDPNRIGAMGFSKGAYTVTRLSDPDHDKQKEWRVFDPNIYPNTTPEPQPWQGYPSQIQVGYQAAGGGTKAFKKWITSPDYVPQVLTCGDRDKYGSWEYWHELVAHFEKRNLPHLALPMPGVGHILIWGYDKELGVDRYTATMNYFDKYLKPGKIEQ